MKINTSVISLMILYDNRKTIMFRVIRDVVYTIVYNYIFLGYLVTIQDNFSKYNNNFEKTKFNDFDEHHVMSWIF